MSFVIQAILMVLALLPLHPLTEAAATRLMLPITPTATAPITADVGSYPATVVPVKKVSSGNDAAANSGPKLSAASWFAMDVTTGQTLAQYHADTQRPIASVTKLATALVIIRSHPLNEIVTVPSLPAYDPADETMGLHPGEKLTILSLLNALLINSEDDVADALALADSGSQDVFAAKMNRLMAEWGIANAHFSNPSGLEDTGNGASAKAVAMIANLALHNPTVKQLVATPAATIQSIDGRPFSLNTTNQLLQNGRFQGIKTGYTPAAGQCFVGLTTIQGHQVITVVLGSQDRFGDSIQLADWINQNYSWQ